MNMFYFFSSYSVSNNFSKYIQ